MLIFFKILNFQLIFLDDDTIVYDKFAGMNLDEKIELSFNSNFLDGHYYRPITSLSFAFDSVLKTEYYSQYHLTNFIIHLITCIIIFLVFTELGYSLIIILLTTLLFAINPIHINAVGWIAGRGDLLATFFSISAFLMFLKFIKNNKPYLLIFVSILLSLAILSKEVSLIVPFLFLSFYLIEKKGSSLNKYGLSVVVMIIVVLGFYYLLRSVILSQVHIDKFSFTTYSKNILVLPETISKFFIPTGIKALPGFEPFTSISGIILLVIFILLPIKLKSINKLRYYLGLLWFILLLIPGMVLRRMEQDGFYYWDCRSYLPSIGIIMMVAEIIKVIDLQKCRNICLVIIGIYLMILGSFTFEKIKVYENPLIYWNAVKADYPSRFLPYLGLYNYYNYIGDKNNSEIQLTNAIKIAPKELILRKSLANFYLTKSEQKKGFIFLNETLLDEKIYSDELIAKFISLCIQMQKLDYIDRLILLYSEDEDISNKIKRIILKEETALKVTGDSLNYSFPFEK